MGRNSQAKNKEPKPSKRTTRAPVKPKIKGGKSTDLSKVSGSGTGGMKKNKGNWSSTC